MGISEKVCCICTGQKVAFPHNGFAMPTETNPQVPTRFLQSHAIRLALALSLGAAVSLGITRFAYGLLLPPMRADLGWSYTLAGA